MGALLFSTTKLSGLHAAGRTADLQRELLAAMLERHLGPAYADCSRNSKPAIPTPATGLSTPRPRPSTSETCRLTTPPR